MIHPVIFVVGPTAVGKSDFALKAATQFHAAVLNCDSLQAYRRLDIGTAKPSASEQNLVPHFLFDVRAPGELLTAGDYRLMAHEILRQETARGPVIVVGGSGFYIQALEKGMFDVPKSDPTLEKKVRDDLLQLGLPALWRELQSLDPEYAEGISPNDSYRISRALVVIRERGIKVSSLRKQFKPEPFPYPLIKMGFTMDRELLKSRIQERTNKMIAAGLMAEVAQLVSEGFAEWPPLQSVGYRECMMVLKGVLPQHQLAEQIVEKTMQLAKKQMTWFRRDKDITWFSDPKLALQWLGEKI